MDRSGATLSRTGRPELTSPSGKRVTLEPVGFLGRSLPEINHCPTLVVAPNLPFSFLVNSYGRLMAQALPQSGMVEQDVLQPSLHFW